jgi:ankyrin repeat protein
MQPVLRTIRRQCMEVYVSTLPERSNLDHLRKQAKELLRLYRAADPAAYQRLRESLPAARGRGDAALAAMQLRLHDMQSCIAREYGFASWSDLKDGVELRRAQSRDLQELRTYWLHLVYGGDVAGGLGRQRPDLAARVLGVNPQIAGDDPYLACAVGDESTIRRAIDSDPAWVNRSGGPLNIPPLIAVTHSAFAKLDSHRQAMHRSLRLLLERGADPNQYFHNRWPPNSLEKPGDEKLTAIYGAAGKIHDVDMTKMLLAAGADPNDNESLYHSIDDPDHRLPCMRALLEGGARVPGSNALAKILDIDHLEGLQLLLAHHPKGDPDLNRILHWAIYRGRSAAHVKAILDAGADPRSPDAQRQSAYRHAASVGLPEVMRLLEKGGSGEPLSDEEKFVSACARADGAEARRLLDAKPDLFKSLTPAQLKQLPLVAMAGRDDAVRVMVSLGWPVAERGGDIDGSALNWAVFRGRPELTEFLLQHGASFREPHGYGSDVLGTLSWASLNQPRADGDWAGCAAALRAHGMPGGKLLKEQGPDKAFRALHIDGRSALFPEDVAEVLLDAED